MKRMLINARQPDELRVAITDGGQLIDLDIEIPGQEQKKANIYKGIITSIEPSLGAVFVNYGGEKHGFLPLKEISPEYYLTHDPEALEPPDLQKLLQIGQPLVVQIEKEERGTKGAALTTYISLAGSFLVLMPNNPSAGGISRRIEGEERDELREVINQLSVPEGMGVIIRTAGVGRNKEELEWDLSVLLKYWEAVKMAATAKQGAYLIHQESDVVIRAIRDYLRRDIEEIVIDHEKAYELARNYLSQIRPDFLERLKLYADPLPLFSRFQIEQHIESAYDREVRLPSGGSLVIDHTEALVAIDINSARATKGSNIEETAFNTNLEAAEEIARQLRIRDIGGLVVIDFIDMTPTKHQREVENRLRTALQQDRARIQIGRISRFGLLEMSRQRLRSSLTRASHVPCERCMGQGTVRSVESQALSIIHLVQEKSAKAGQSLFHLQLPIDVATYILNEKRNLVKEIEDHCHVKVIIVPNEYLESPHYHLKQSKLDPSSDVNKIPSYKWVKNPKTEGTLAKAATVSVEEPAITQFLSSESIPAARSKKRRHSSGLIKRLWDKMFGTEEHSSQLPFTPGAQRKRSNKDFHHRKRTSHHSETSGTASHSGHTPRESSHPNKRHRPSDKNPRGGSGNPHSRHRSSHSTKPRHQQPRETDDKLSEFISQPTDLTPPPHVTQPDYPTYDEGSNTNNTPEKKE